MSGKPHDSSTVASSAADRLLAEVRTVEIAKGGLDALFRADPLEDRTGSEATSRWNMEAAYGFPAVAGRATGSPYVGLGLPRRMP